MNSRGMRAINGWRLDAFQQTLIQGECTILELSAIRKVFRKIAFSLLCVERGELDRLNVRGTLCNFRFPVQCAGRQYKPCFGLMSNFCKLVKNIASAEREMSMTAKFIKAIKYEADQALL